MTVTIEGPITDERLRALRAAKRAPVYLVAAQAKIHPSRLSAYLNGREPMPAGVPERILAVLNDFQALGE